MSSHHESGSDSPTRRKTSESMVSSRKNSIADPLFHYLASKIQPERKTFKQVCIDYCQITSAHGVSHAATAPTKGWKWFWIFVTVICMGLMTYQIYQVFAGYFAYETSVSLQLKYEAALFPSVTICNLNPYKNSLLMKNPTLSDTINSFKNAVAASEETDKKRIRRQTNPNPRYRPMLATCVCEVDRMTGLKADDKTGCLPSYKGTTAHDLTLSARSRSTAYRTAYCICDFDTATNSSWPCYPHSTWMKKSCNLCINGRCRIAEGSADGVKKNNQMCYCHNEYNLCVSLPDNTKLVDVTKFLEHMDDDKELSTTTTTTQAPAAVEAQGYKELKDEVVIAVKGRENMMFAAQALSPQELEGLSYTLNDTILRCSFDGKECDLQKDFKLTRDASYGNCFTFNHEFATDRVASRAGANYGLRVLLNVDVDDYLPTTEGAGVRVAVHKPQQVPFPDAFGYSAPTGFLSSFGVKMKTMERLPDPYGACKKDVKTAPNYIYYPFEYSVEGCYRDCFQHKVLNRCGCGDPKYPVPPGNKTCPVNDPVARKCLDEQVAVAKEESSDCLCQQACDESSFEAIFSAAEWPSGAAKLPDCDQGDATCVNRFRENAAMVQVFYQELNFELLTESPAYPFVQVLADLGGLVGLWLGLSLISLLELVIFFYQIFKWGSQSYISEHEQHEQEEVAANTELNAVMTGDGRHEREDGWNKDVQLKPPPNGSALHDDGDNSSGSLKNRKPGAERVNEMFNSDQKALLMDHTDEDTSPNTTVDSNGNRESWEPSHSWDKRDTARL